MGSCTRCCANCRCVMRLENQGQTWLVCPNRPRREGQLTAVEPGDGCRDFVPCSQPQQVPGEATRLIPLANIDGVCALVDPADYEWLSRYTWHAVCGGGGTLYACTFCKGKQCLMHRMLMNPPEGMLVDHKNRCGLDNHRINLRNATHQQNCANRRRKPGVSGFRGVLPQGDKWQAQLMNRGKLLYLGLFDDPVEAAKAWDRKAFELHGEFAWLNFPDEFKVRYVGLRGRITVRSGAEARLRRATHSPSQEPSPMPAVLPMPRRECTASRKSFEGRQVPAFLVRVPVCGRPAARAQDVVHTMHDEPKTPRPAPYGHGPRVYLTLRRPALVARGPPNSPSVIHHF